MRKKKARDVLPRFPCWFLLPLMMFLTTCASVEIKTRNGVYHPVESGETLWRICAAYGVDMMTVCMFNGITDPASIRAGQRLFIPGAQAVARVGPAVPGKEEAPRAVDRPGTPPPDGQAEPALRFRWPVQGGRITSTFGVRDGRRHDGIDIAAPHGTPVYTAETGKVVYSGSGLRGYGNMIIIRHREPYSTVYAHNDKNLVAVDAEVRKGQQIATVGSTGLASGNHLHFEIRKKVKPVDPMRYLPNPEGQGGAR